MSDGCTNYIKTTVEIFFPEGQVGCRYCPLLETYSRNQCRRTGEYIVDTRFVGRWCPLIEEGEDG